MSRRLMPLPLVAVLFFGTALADGPEVAVDIAPVHSLVARVMEGVGTPGLIVQQGASPHEYSLRPSEAALLQGADLVFWMGESLTPWLAGAVATLAQDAEVVTLLESEVTDLLAFRENAVFEAHVHHQEEHHASDDDHDEDHDHAHESDDHDHHDHDHHDHDHHDHDHHGHAQQTTGGEHDHGHDHGEQDPHAWLSPSNAQAWLDLIAGRLSVADPDNASLYFRNAAEAREEIEAVVAEVETILNPVRAGQFIVFHDAYQYFEVEFDFRASGSITLSDAVDPSPARIAEIQARVRAGGIDCVLSEPQFNPGLVATVMDGSEARTAILDPLGSSLDRGSNLYPQLLRQLARSLAACLS